MTDDSRPDMNSSHGSGKPRWWFVISAGVLAVFNVARSTGLFGGLDAVILLLLVGTLTAWLLRQGLTSSDLGLERESIRAGLTVGAVAFGAVLLVMGIAAAIPATSRFLEDDRARIGVGALLYQLTIPIFLLTAIPEELAFRGILLGSAMRSWGTRSAVLFSSILFGLWHIGPTLSTMGANAQASEIVSNTGGYTLVVVANVCFTFSAGLFFCWLRLRSRSLIAPTIAHLATNGVSLIVAWVTVR